MHFTLQVTARSQVAHQAGIVHRNLKPANCFVVARCGVGHAHSSVFDIVRDPDPTERQQAGAATHSSLAPVRGHLEATLFGCAALVWQESLEEYEDAARVRLVHFATGASSRRANAA